MSDRGRNRRPARSSKATPPQAAADSPIEPDESTTASAAPADEEVAETPAADVADVSNESDESDESDVSDVSGETGDSDGSGDAEKSDNDAEKSDKGKKSKAPAPLSKAEKRAAARVAAAKVARRRRIGGVIAGTLIVLLALGGALAGVWYFGDRAEKQKTECKKPDQQSYPPLLGGFDKKLNDEPKVEAGKEAKVAVRNVQVVIKGSCKTVKPGDTVVVNYIGATYKDGKVFDSSWQRKQTFPVQVGMLEQHQQPQVIEGWDRGLVGLKVGSRVVLDVPAKEAYEANGPAPQGYPQGDLRFYVDILDIQAPDAGGGLNGGLGGN